MAPEAVGSRVGELGFLAIGSVPPELAQGLLERVSRDVALPCRWLVGEPAPAARSLEGRAQADADALLADLEERAGGGRVLVGVTDLDLGHPIFTFFFGRARLHGTAALVSLARLAPAFYGLPDDPRVTIRRAAREVIHELGHVAGLKHCDRYDCIMHFANDVGAIDLRGAGFCDACVRALPPGMFAAR